MSFDNTTLIQRYSSLHRFDILCIDTISPLKAQHNQQGLSDPLHYIAERSIKPKEGQLTSHCEI